ncbi:hypothetical protein D9M72_424870 [compost metagenome]
MLIAGLADQAALGAQHLGDGLVGFEHLQPNDVVQLAVREERQELGALVHGQHHGDAGLFTDLLVVLTVGGRLVDDAGAVGGGDVVRHQEAPGILCAVLFGIAEVVPERLVRQAGKFGASVSGGDCGFRLLNAGGAVAVAKVLGVGAQQVRGEQEAASDRGIRGRRFDAVGSGRKHRIGDGLPDGERQVGGQCPRRGGPGERLDSGKLPGQFRLPRRDGEGDRDGLVLAVLVDVVIHAQFMVGQRGLVLPAVRQDAVAVVGQALFVQLLEGPEH